MILIFKHKIKVNRINLTQIWVDLKPMLDFLIILNLLIKWLRIGIIKTNCKYFKTIILLKQVKDKVSLLISIIWEIFRIMIHSFKITKIMILDLIDLQQAT